MPGPATAQGEGTLLEVTVNEISSFAALSELGENADAAPARNERCA